MKFQDRHKDFFKCVDGAFSEVTLTEYKDGQITLDKEEKKLFLDFFGSENILHGNKASDPNLAQKDFLLYPNFEKINLSLLYPKNNKSELRLYLAKDHGYRPKAEYVWFAYITKEHQLVLGSMSREDWEEIGQKIQLNFQPRARLLLQLGDQLIRNESIALTELVKNSYDADASYCKVKLLDVHDLERGKIVIEDDGWGMNLSTIKNAWLEPGSDNKEKIVREKLYSAKGRLPIGEKGIGRFGVHKLGREIELITRSSGEQEVVVNINWDSFKDYKYLKDAPVTAIEREPRVFIGSQTGTKITIKKLSTSWTRGKLRDAYRAINAISVPSTYDIDQIINAREDKQLSRKDPNAFEVLPETNLVDWIADIPKWQDILQYALFFFNIDILDDKITKFRYRFRPWDNMTKITGTAITEKDNPIAGLLDIEVPDKKKFEPLSIPTGVEIGQINFQGCIFVRDRSILNIALNKPTFLTDYLNENGGVRIYRNDLRIYDYGEKGNDWLGLDYKRFNNPSLKVSNNLILASIRLDRKASSSLIEKTNREGFIENKAYEIFSQQISYALRLIELCRESDKRRLDPIYKPKVETESVLKSINNLVEFIDEKITNPLINKELKIYTNKIEANYKFMYDKLIKSSSAGMGWSIYLHEIEKIIKEIERVVRNNSDKDRSVKLVAHLSKLIENYSQILRKSERTVESLKKLIEQSLFNVEYRFKAHKIQIEQEFLKSELSDKIKVSRNLIISTLMNIYDNSIYWLDRAGRENKKIRIAISNEKEGYISIVISDNGTGFLLSPEQMIEPLMSARGGMGMGLHLAKEIMNSHPGSILSFNEYGEFTIPTDYKEGATVVLSFKM